MCDTDTTGLGNCVAWKVVHSVRKYGNGLDDSSA